jgi:hypothetical protein
VLVVWLFTALLSSFLDMCKIPRHISGWESPSQTQDFLLQVGGSCITWVILQFLDLLRAHSSALMPGTQKVSPYSLKPASTGHQILSELRSCSSLQWSSFHHSWRLDGHAWWLRTSCPHLKVTLSKSVKVGLNCYKGLGHIVPWKPSSLSFPSWMWLFPWHLPQEAWVKAMYHTEC